MLVTLLVCGLDKRTLCTALVMVAAAGPSSFAVIVLAVSLQFSWFGGGWPGTTTTTTSLPLPAAPATSCPVAPDLPGSTGWQLGLAAVLGCIVGVGVTSLLVTASAGLFGFGAGSLLGAGFAGAGRGRSHRVQDSPRRLIDQDLIIYGGGSEGRGGASGTGQWGSPVTDDSW